MSTPAPPPALPDRAAFERDGFAVVPRFVGARTIQSLIRAVNDLMRDGRQLTADATYHGVQYQVQSATGRPRDGAVAPGAFRKLIFPHKAHRRFAMLRHDERIQAGLAALGLVEPKCVVDQVNLKLPRVGTAFPWHQDAQFVSWRQRADIEAHGGANVVIALDAADEENGTFEVLRGSHLGGARPFDYDLGASPQDDGPSARLGDASWDESTRQALSLAPGDAVFFHPFLAHGSAPNRSDRQRRLVALWFVGGGGSGGGE